MRIVFIASECSPLAKVGGLADVVGSLPKALLGLGLEVKIIIPNYGTIDKKQFPQEKIAGGEIFYKEKLEKFEVFRTNLADAHKKEIDIFLISHPLLSSNGIYLSADATVKGVEEVERFAFFSQSALEFLKEWNFSPDIIHCHDWHTALIPDLLKVKYANVDKLKKAAVVLTIHNMGEAYQGIADFSILRVLDMDEEHWSGGIRDERPEEINFLQRGILGADVLNTVSPQYAKEILTEEFGGKLSRYLRERKERLFGILNGIDYEVFDPRKDPTIWQNYDISTWPKGKLANKVKLEEKLGLAHDGKLLIGMVSRLDKQKGFDILLPVLPQILNSGAKVITLGAGSPYYEDQWQELCRKYSLSTSCNLRFDPILANQIYAGADCFLMPSRFEPCGLGQMIAMRYGTIPIVRDVGGLHDTVINRRTGFVFKDYSSESLLAAVGEALNTFKNKEKWARMVEEAQRQDFSWTRSAREYLKLYERALKLHNIHNTIR